MCGSVLEGTGPIFVQGELGHFPNGLHLGTVCVFCFRLLELQAKTTLDFFAQHLLHLSCVVGGQLVVSSLELDLSLLDQFFSADLVFEPVIHALGERLCQVFESWVIACHFCKLRDWAEL